MKRIAIVCVALLVLVAGGSAFATIPGTDGVIHSCVLKANGTIRLIDVTLGQKCKKATERPLDWRQNGGLTWRGEWSDATSYVSNDAVQYLGNAFVARGPSRGDAPPGSSWDLLASRGDPGADGAQGPQGPAGPQGPKGDDGDAGPPGLPGADGSPGLVWLGRWDDGLKYSPNDAVELGGSAYVANQTSVGDQPPSDSWDVLAAQGEPGPMGPQGLQGSPGPQGPPGPSGAPGFDRTQPYGNQSATIDDNIHAAVTSATVGSGGLGLIVYSQGPVAFLQVAVCGDPACSTATTSDVGEERTRGTDASVAIGADGLGLIAFSDGGDLTVAHCLDSDCSSADGASIGTGVARDTSVTIGADGLGLIAFYDGSAGDLDVAHCSNVGCTAATVTHVDSVGNVGMHPSITIGIDGLGLVSYVDHDNQALKVAHCSNLACTTATKTSIDNNARDDTSTSITTGADGMGLISSLTDSSGNGLVVAHCSNVACTSATKATIDNGIGVAGGAVGAYSSVTIGSDGLGLVSYFDALNGDLKLARCLDVTCSKATTSTLDSAGIVGTYASVTIGSDGLALVSSIDDTNDSLKVVHCSNTFCVPYFRRR